MAKMSLLAIPYLLGGLIAGAAGSIMQPAIFASEEHPQSAGSFQLAAVYCQTKSWISTECIYFKKECIYFKKKMSCHNIRV